PLRQPPEPLAEAVHAHRRVPTPRRALPLLTLPRPRKNVALRLPPFLFEPPLSRQQRLLYHVEHRYGTPALSLDDGRREDNLVLVPQDVFPAELAEFAGPHGRVPQHEQLLAEIPRAACEVAVGALVEQVPELLVRHQPLPGLFGQVFDFL